MFNTATSIHICFLSFPCGFVLCHSPVVFCLLSCALNTLMLRRPGLCCSVKWNHTHLLCHHWSYIISLSLIQTHTCSLCHIHLYALISSPPSLSTPCRGLCLCSRSLPPSPVCLVHTLAFFFSLFASVSSTLSISTSYSLILSCCLSVSQLVGNVVNSPAFKP